MTSNDISTDISKEDQKNQPVFGSVALCFWLLGPLGRPATARSLGFFWCQQLPLVPKEPSAAADPETGAEPLDILRQK